MRIRWVREIMTGQFIVDILGFRIGVDRDTMIRVVGVSPKSVLGSTTITDEQLAAIGFYIVPAAQSEVIAV